MSLSKNIPSRISTSKMDISDLLAESDSDVELAADVDLEGLLKDEDSDNESTSNLRAAAHKSLKSPRTPKQEGSSSSIWGVQSSKKSEPAASSTLWGIKTPNSSEPTAAPRTEYGSDKFDETLLSSDSEEEREAIASISGDMNREVFSMNDAEVDDIIAEADQMPSVEELQRECLESLAVAASIQQSTSSSFPLNAQSRLELAESRSA